MKKHANKKKQWSKWDTKLKKQFEQFHWAVGKLKRSKIHINWKERMKNETKQKKNYIKSKMYVYITTQRRFKIVCKIINL